MLRDLGVKPGKTMPPSVLDRLTSENDLIVVSNFAALAASGTPDLSADVSQGLNLAGSPDE